ncbi:MAG: hypothetical protein AAFX95_22540 [Cyanobacteria bacterium J06639_16]
MISLKRATVSIGLLTFVVLGAMAMPVWAEGGSSDRGNFPGRQVGGGTR